MNVIPKVEQNTTEKGVEKDNAPTEKLHFPLLLVSRPANQRVAINLNCFIFVVVLSCIFFSDKKT